jgi:hypothetical protein
MKRFTEAILVLAIVLSTASVCWGQFTTVPPGFTQAIFGTSTSSLGGVAFAPNGDVWADNCAFDSGTMFRFPLQGHPVAVNSGTSGLAGCGLTNHPNGNLYSNTDLGVVELSDPMTNATAPTLLRTIGSPGNALGITVDPQTNHLVYVGIDCRFTPTCTIYDLDPSISGPTSTVLKVLDRSVAAFVDGIAFDPSGNFLFLSTRSHWDGTAYVNFFAITILKRDGTLVRQVINNICGECTPHEPDGIAFHAASPQFVVTDNTDGTMTRFDFPNNDFTMIPTGSTFASGGTRGDLSQVGSDGCLYISQGQGTASEDIAQICGGFAPSANSQSVTLHFIPSPTPETQTAAFLTNNNPNDPASHAMSLTVTSVLKSFDVVLTAHYVPTEFSTGRTGPDIADGICEAGSGAPTDNNIDCRLAAGGFVYPTTLITPGDQLVPHCSPYHNKMCVWYSVSTTAKATDEGGNDYIGPVAEKMGWNTNVDLANSSLAGTPNREYLPGWNNLNERLYDRHGEDLENFFKFDITAYFDVTCNIFCVLPADQGGGGYTKHFNDFVWADVPNPPTGTAADTVELFVPVPGSSPFPYLSGVPMLVAFELENESREKSDPTALTKPHSVNVATFLNGAEIPVQYPKGFPTTFTYNPFFKLYYIFLSPAPYLTDGTVYTMQIGCDLFPNPVTVRFLVKKFQF